MKQKFHHTCKDGFNNFVNCTLELFCEFPFTLAENNERWWLTKKMMS